MYYGVEETNGEKTQGDQADQRHQLGKKEKGNENMCSRNISSLNLF